MVRGCRGYHGLHVAATRENWDKKIGMREARVLTFGLVGKRVYPARWMGLDMEKMGPGTTSCIKNQPNFEHCVGCNPLP
jgi:hypothetical protein